MTLRVLVTGASGEIGSRFVEACENGEIAAGDALDLVRCDLVDRVPTSRYPFTVVDVRDVGAVRTVCRDVDAILHLAADPDPDADFYASVLPVNVAGTYNVATAAVRWSVRRFVFASSAQAIAGYPLDHQVRETDPAVPANDYGVGKAFGEALCASLAARSSTTFVSIRVGNYAAERPDPSASFRDRAAWLSPRDANQLLLRSVLADVDGAIVVHGISNNATKQLSIEATRAALAYEPVDDAFASG